MCNVEMEATEMDYKAQIKEYIELESKVLKNLDIYAIDNAMNPGSYTHLTLPTTPYV